MSQPSAGESVEQVRACSAAAPEAPGHSPPTVAALDASQETDLWWGAYSGWTMLPSLLVCLLLTGAIAWFAFALARPMAQTVTLGAAGLVWLIQLVRWSHRCLTFNYRLTSRRVFIDRGLLFAERFQVGLGDITHTSLEQNALERLIGVGKVCLRLRVSGHERLELAGVRNPQVAAKLIEDARLRLVT